MECGTGRDSVGLAVEEAQRETVDEEETDTAAAAVAVAALLETAL